MDGDPPNTDNSRLTFTITFADTTPSTSLFTIGATSGQVSASPLDYEAVPSHMHGLTVTVRDAGSPPLSTTCSLTVNIRVSIDYYIVTIEQSGI